jgi:hypothetical protein
MLVYAFLLILLLRPSWGLWGLFSIVAAALGVWAGFAAGYDPMTTAIGALVQGVIFCGLGALIVFLRLRFGKGRSRDDKEVDAELARIRAEAAARENPPPQ